MIERISVIGLGRLGLPLAVVLARRGFNVVGVDIDPNVIDSVKKCKPLIYEPGLEGMMREVKTRLAVTDNLQLGVETTGASIILVPTPSNPKGDFSLSYVLKVCEGIGKALYEKEEYHLVVVGSTVMPGACDGEIRGVLEKESGKQIGDFGLCYCPEFVMLGNVIEGFLAPDFVLIGASDPLASSVMGEIYKRLCLNDPPVATTNLINAEIAKVALNCYVTTKITFANQLAEYCEGVQGADVDVITGAIGLDSRIGKKYLRGATAYSGPCFPRDARSLIYAAKSVGVDLPLVETVDMLNRWQIERLARMVRSHATRIQATKIGVLGLAYKPGTNLVEESAGASLVEKLRFPVDVIAFDPMVAIGQSVRTAQICADISDIIVITTPWAEFKEVKFHTRQVVIDCWRILDRKRVEGAGAEYISIGVGISA